MYLLDVKSLRFYLNPDIHINPFGFSCQVSSFEEISFKFETAGTQFLRLKEISLKFLNQQKEGLIHQAFGEGLLEFLIQHYQHQILHIRENILERRTTENQMFKEDIEQT